MTRSVALLVLLSISGAPAHQQLSPDSGDTNELVGLWEARRRFGPDIRGPLVLQRVAGEWRAEIAGRIASARLQGDTIGFELTNGGGPHLAGGVLARAAARPLPELFHDLMAQPMQIDRYYLSLTPTGDAYMGGGARLLPRDFMKLGQLLVNGGTWRGKRILSRDWSRRSTAALHDLRTLKYGYLWWVIDYPYRDRTVRAFFAGGNGGQIVMGVPELDLVIAFYGGNYSDPPISFIPQREYVPGFILTAVK